MTVAIHDVGMIGAWAMINLSIFPQAAYRRSGSLTRLALSMAALIFGSSNSCMLFV